MPRLSTKTALGQILPGFWIGRMAAVRAIFEMQQDESNEKEEEEEWTVISVLSSDSLISTMTESLQDAQQEFGRQLVVRHEVWSLKDKSGSPFVSDRLEEILQIISASMDLKDDKKTDGIVSTHRPRRNCLVHCARGVSRSAAVCAAWLISCRDFSLVEALAQIRTARDVNPNLGFIAGLRAIEKCGGDIQKAQERLTRKHNNNNPTQAQQQHDQAEEEGKGADDANNNITNPQTKTRPDVDLATTSSQRQPKSSQRRSFVSSLFASLKKK